MLFSDASNTYLDFLRHERGLAVSTIKCYGPWLRHYNRFCDQIGLEPHFTARMSASACKRYLYECGARKFRPRTTRNAFAALRGFARFGIEQGWISADPTSSLTMPKKDAASRPIASDEDLEKLMRVVEYERDARKRARKRAMLYVLVMVGVRFSELMDLREQDINLPNKTLTVHAGKGQKTRTLYPPQECLDALSEWIIERRKMGCKHDWLWAFDPARRMGDKGTREMLEALKAQAGLAQVDTIKPHALRRAFATRLLRGGADIKIIQAALGHSDANTTFVYLAMRDLPAQAMADLAALPAPAFSKRPTPPAPLLKDAPKAEQPRQRLASAPINDRATDLRARRTRQASK